MRATYACPRNIRYLCVCICLLNYSASKAQEQSLKFGCLSRKKLPHPPRVHPLPVVGHVVVVVLALVQGVAGQVHVFGHQAGYASLQTREDFLLLGRAASIPSAASSPKRCDEHYVICPRQFLFKALNQLTLTSCPQCTYGGGKIWNPIQPGNLEVISGN